jgi:hypothetical protein
MELPDIESYVEFFFSKDKHMFMPWGSPKFPLSEYDKKFLEDINHNIQIKKKITTKQSVLIDKILKKYKIQFNDLGVELPTHNIYRNGLRVTNFEHTITLNDNVMQLKFPYNIQLVNIIKQHATDLKGTVLWNMDNESWDITLTEHTLSWLIPITRHFKVDPFLIELYNKIIEVKNTPYYIQLTLDDKLHIKNAPKSMVDYVESHGLTNDIVKLVDFSPILEYTVDNNIIDALTMEYGAEFVNYCLQRKHVLADFKNKLPNILNWCIKVNRFPICVYSTNPTDLQIYEPYFDKESTLVISKKNMDQVDYIDNSISFIFTTEWINFKKPIPLLITRSLTAISSKYDSMPIAEKIICFRG